MVCLLLHSAIVLLPSTILADRLERSSSHGTFETSIDESRGQGADEEMGKRSCKMCYRQRTDTTKYKAGTLPALNMYQTSGTLQSLGERIVWPSEHDEDQNVNVQEKPAEVDMDQASEYDTESDEESEEDENVSAQESSQEVGGKNRELNFLFMAPRTRSGRIIRTSFRALLWQ